MLCLVGGSLVRLMLPPLRRAASLPLIPVSRGVRLLTLSPHRRRLSSREGAVNPSLLQL